ncbi:iron uptake system protein EfeO [Aquitalea magnusonii]|uniref:Iron uptake system EfeUOB component EfeO/EfeM n=2 Tax=Aquitalea magnusonii TaxID=332411 RepID=A0A318J8R8_9NEIS|nr:iron uptake system protein EfeO [Aquitalea magnusonii]PXX44638.1 iron uptake system EfeUOB component EfeO/EfeM [Aquitalea magnusonii]
MTHRSLFKLSLLALLVSTLAACGKSEDAPVAQASSAAVAAASAAAVDYSAQLAGPIADYKQYVTSELAGLLTQSKAFAAAIKAGELKKAQELYPITRQHYERIEPIAELFSDMDGAIDAREDDFKQKAADPKFTGFHRLEKALFGDHTTKGQAEYADKLVADISTLQSRVQTLSIPPAKMVGGAAGLIEEVAATKISGEEDRYSHTDLWDFRANVDGAQKIVELLRPLLQKASPDLLAKVDENFKSVDSLLDKYRSEDKQGFVSYDKLTDADRTAMKGPITALAEDLSKLRGVLGLD